MGLDFKVNTKVLIRVDFNVPFNNGKITDLTRIISAIPTIKYFLKLNMSVILMSHFGRPDGVDKNYSLEIIKSSLSRLLNQEILFCSEINNKNSRLVKQLQPKEILLLENLRFFPGETSNNESFARLLSNYGDLYVNDAFGASHRDHASISKIHNFFPEKKYMGFLLQKEIAELETLQANSKKPYTIIVGGSKIGSKIHMLKAFLNVATHILIGGGMAFPFIKYLGGEIGNSLCDNAELNVVKEFLIESKKSTTKIILPIDCLVTNSMKNTQNIKFSNIKLIPDNYMGVDIGPQTIDLFNRFIISSKSIMWNGPMGVAEIDEFSNGTKAISNMIARATHAGAYSLIGGGDTVSDISRFGLKEKFSYVSTGGGAMLQFFKNQDLPGIRGLKKIIK